MTTARRSRGSRRPTWCWSGCRAVRRRRPASIWPIAASRRPTFRWCRTCRSRPDWRPSQCPVIGLTLEADALIEIRRHRLRLIGAGNSAGIVRQNSTEYVDEDAVKAELLWARRLCNRRGWPVIDVTRRSIEETAATVLQLMEAWHERRRKARRGPRHDAPASGSSADPGQCLLFPPAVLRRRPHFAVQPAHHRRGRGQATARGRLASTRPRPRCCLAELKAQAGCTGERRGAGDWRRPDTGV